MVLISSQGLYDGDNPVFSEGMAIASHNVTATVKNRLRTPRLAIIEFILDELSETGNTGKMLHLSLVSNYPSEKRGDLHHEVIRFNLHNDKAIGEHQAFVKKRVGELRKMQVFLLLSHLHADLLTVLISRNDFDHAVVIVHTHSDDGRGDLFFTSMDDNHKMPLAATVESVSLPLEVCGNINRSWLVF